jgi:hypothetical protein
MVGQITKEIVGEKPRIIRPFENMTKAEVVASCPDKEWIKKTFSCSSTTRFAMEEGGANCGTCFACIVRRLAVLVSGADDCEYAYPLTSQKALDNAVQLLRFSLDFLSDRDAIPWYTLDTLKFYEKGDLFERFALDNLAGLMLLSGQGGINPVLGKIRDLCTQRKIPDAVLRGRVDIVRSKKVNADYRNVL